MPLQKKMDPEIAAALQRAGAGDNAAAEGEKSGEVKGEEADELLPGMAFMMSCYEDELKKPIRNIVNGSLLRAILIQVTFSSSLDHIMLLIQAYIRVRRVMAALLCRPKTKVTRTRHSKV